KRRVVQEKDGLAVLDRARLDHGEGVVEAELKDLDVLAFARDPAAAPDPHRGIVGSDEEMKALGDRAWTHEASEDLAHVAELEPELFLNLNADALFGRGRIEEPGRSLDQQVIASVDIGGIAELPGEQDRAPLRVVGQQGCAVAAVIGLAAYR